MTCSLGIVKFMHMCNPNITLKPFISFHKFRENKIVVNKYNAVNIQSESNVSREAVFLIPVLLIINFFVNCFCLASYC